MTGSEGINVLKKVLNCITSFFHALFQKMQMTLFSQTLSTIVVNFYNFDNLIEKNVFSLF